MKIIEVMTRNVAVCHPQTPVSEAARIMWEQDIGFLPVTDSDSGELRGVITDRDICMAAFSQGKALWEIPTAVAMARTVFACADEDDVAAAQAVMRERQVRRLPITDRGGRLVGVLSLIDLARKADSGRPASLVKDVTASLASIGRSRGTSPGARAGAEGDNLASSLQ